MHPPLELAREHERNYRHIFDSSPFPIYLYDTATLASTEPSDTVTTRSKALSLASARLPASAACRSMIASRRSCPKRQTKLGLPSRAASGSRATECEAG